MGTLGNPINAPEEEQTFGGGLVPTFTAGRLGEPVKSESSAGDITMNFLSGFNKAAYLVSGAQGYEEIVKLTGFDEWQKEHGDVGGFLKEFLGLSYEPQNASERVAQRAGEDAVLGTIMAAGALVTGGATEVVPLAAPIGQRVIGSMVTASRNSPLLASLAETFGWGAFGGGSEAAKEGGFGPTGQMVAGLGAAGGLPMIAKEMVVGLAPVVKFVGKKTLDVVPSIMGARWLWKTFGKPASEALAEKQVAKAIESGSANQKEMDEVYGIFDALGVPRPTIAEASGSPQLLAAQRAIELNARGSTLDFLVGRKTKGAQGVEDAVRGSGPTASAPEETIIVSARSELSRLRGASTRKIEGVEEQLAASADRLPSSNRQEIGSVLRDRRGALREDARIEFEQRADDIGLNNSDAVFDITPFKQAIDQKFFGPRRPLSSKNRAGALVDVHNLRVDPKTKRVFNDWGGIQEYRQRLNDDITGAYLAGRMKDYRNLLEAKSMLDSFVAKSEPAMVNPKDWQSFRVDYGEKFINRFEKGVAYKVGQSGKRDLYVTRDEEVADAFLRSESTVDDFFRLYGADEEAMIAMRSAVFDRANQASVVEGIVDPVKLSAWLHTNKRVLDKFPDIQASLSSTRDSVRSLSARQAVLEKRAKDLESSSLAREIEILGREGFDSMLDAAIKDPNKMRSLLRATERLGYDRAPLATVIWDRALAHLPEGQLPSMATFKTFLARNEKSLRIALGDRHFDNLENIYKGIDVLARTPIPTGQPLTTGPLDALEQKLGTGIPQLSSRFFATQSGRVGPHYMAVDLGSRLANRWGHQKAEALMYEALFNEKLTNDLVKIQLSRKINPVVKKRIDGYLFNMGLGEEEQ